MQEGWESVYPPPIVPKLQCGVLSVRKEMNKEANLPCGNYWTIRAAWDHTNDKESFFYNLEDS